MKHQEIIATMNLTDKIAFCSGASQWKTKGFQMYSIPSILMTDGPHGLRKVLTSEDALGDEVSHNATCFPTASATACSWDRALLQEMGQALADEALKEQVSVILGPGVNIQRNPLCGRNFEYFSEDPYLAGEMGTAWIRGVQSKGIGVSLKHFAGNNQEHLRMTSDSLIDERALREIYLPAFEKAVKTARPITVMCAYNKLNGTYCSDHAYLLREILRGEWGFEGVVISDWGGMGDRVKAFEAGLDLEMPGVVGLFDADVLAAVEKGGLAEERIDECVDRLLEMVDAADKNKKINFTYDVESHHQLARKIAAHSAVLLKNQDGILPIQSYQKIAVIGALAKFPRYQGAGSSIVNPTKLSSALDGFKALGFEISYYPGYLLKGVGSQTLVDEAVVGANKSDIAIIFAGLTGEYESEGFDRNTLSMPESQNELIRRVAAAQPNTVVVLAGGAPVEMPWLPQVKAVLNMLLSGQAGGLAAADILTGKVNPSGKLAATYPIRYADVPSAGFYEEGGRQAQYRESIYVGYRYYDKAGKEVLFPFGHGLSYTTFEYRDLSLSSSEMQAAGALKVAVTVKNTGERDGAEIVQLYIGDLTPGIFRPEKELRDFSKIFLNTGEEKQVEFTLDARAFSFYDPDSRAWMVPEGVYQISVGSSSRDIRLQDRVTVRGAIRDLADASIPAWYRQLTGKVSSTDFESILGRPIEPVKSPRAGEYSLSSTFQEMRESLVIRMVMRYYMKILVENYGSTEPNDPNFRMVVEGFKNKPLKNMVVMSKGVFPPEIARGLVDIANGKLFKGAMRIIRNKSSSHKK